MKEQNYIPAFLLLVGVFVIGVILLELKTVLLPFAIAALLSFIFKPVVLYLESKSVPMVFSLVVVLLSVAGIVFILSLVVYATLESFIRELPKYQARLNLIASDIQQITDSLASQLQLKAEDVAWKEVFHLSRVVSYLTATVGGFFSFLGNVVLVLLFMFFLLAGSGQMSVKLKRAFSTDQAARFASVIEAVDRDVRKYLLTKTLISMATGVLAMVILLIIGVDFALLWGVLTFFLNFIPTLGSIVATLLPATIALLQFDSPVPALLVLLLVGALQMGIGNVLEPRIMSTRLDLSPLIILVALIFWGWLWGIWGMILAVPILATVKIIMEHVDQLRPLAVLMGGKKEG